MASDVSSRSVETRTSSSALSSSRAATTPSFQNEQIGTSSEAGYFSQVFLIDSLLLLGSSVSGTDRNIQIRLKFLDDSQRIINTDLNVTVLQFKRLVTLHGVKNSIRTNFPTDLREGKVIRLIFRGKLMRDDKLTLEAYGLYNDCIVHCHISNTPYEQPEV